MSLPSKCVYNTIMKQGSQTVTLFHFKKGSRLEYFVDMEIYLSYLVTDMLL